MMIVAVDTFDPRGWHCLHTNTEEKYKSNLRPLWISSVELLKVDLCGCKTYVELNH